MEWTNDLALEFIELLQSEPVLWNIKSKNHKNRNLVNDAWIRIVNSFSVPASIDELKKKKNSMLTQYRDCIKKVKEYANGSEGDVFKPSWFAFDLLNNFLGGIYEYPSFNTQMSEEEPICKIESHFSHESNTEYANESIQADECTDRRLSQESIISTNQYQSGTSNASKQQTEMRKTEGVFPMINERRAQEESKAVDECEIYGQLLAQKLKKIDEDDRLILMNDIDNLTFKYIMTSRARKRSYSSAITSTE